MKKIFLYGISINSDTLRFLKKKGYTCLELTSKEEDFWNVLNDLSEGDTLVLLSHGDHKGPLGVEGDKGKDIDMDRFGRILNSKRVKLYLLSCYTGNEPCAGSLAKFRDLEFIAPKGCASIYPIADAIVIKSVIKGPGKDEYPGWSGTDSLKPSRNSSPVDLP